jgi:hypothetical protein
LWEKYERIGVTITRPYDGDLKGPYTEKYPLGVPRKAHSVYEIVVASEKFVVYIYHSSPGGWPKVPAVDEYTPIAGCPLGLYGRRGCAVYAVTRDPYINWDW